MTIAIILLIGALTGGGVSVAANSSLPGDALYGIKTGVNERIETAMSFGAEAKANTNAKLALARVQEMESLSIKGKIDADVASDLEARFKARAEKAQAEADSLSAGAKANVSAKFESSLKTHASVLAQLGAKETDDQTALSALSVRVNNALGVAAQSRIKAEAEASTEVGADIQARAEGKMKAAQNKINEAESFISKIRASAGVTATANAEAKLALANQDFAAAEAKLNAEAYGEAFILFAKAHREAQDAKESIESRNNLNLNIESSSENEDSNNPNSAGVKVDVNAESNNNSTSGSAEIKIGL